MYKELLRPILFAFDSEKVHHLMIRCAKWMGAASPCGVFCCGKDVKLQRECFGVEFANPLGLAAGFDKNAEILPFLFALGFGHVEVGTVTPLPQSGNPKPRIFRLPQDEALINRMGFPSEGTQVVRKRLESFRSQYGSTPRIGANIGKNRDTSLEDAAQDYHTVAASLAPFVDWITINVSSPNTPGLRSLQSVEALKGIIESVQSAVSSDPPILVKLSPDLNREDLFAILALLLERRVAGVIASNTTLSREGLTRSSAVGEGKIQPVDEAGGLSGKPLYHRTLQAVREIVECTDGKLPIVAVGGISTPSEGAALLHAGASLLQGYTAFIYEGPGWPRKMLRGLSSNICSTDLHRELASSRI
ncbi:MAG: quinone-dependent dihydroorotate dehydrogenase [Bdellovibrionales bacterium]|nr:quinone-dependent dihydroorotate dehydrogenase [Bdellovibrionales bacterium]